MTFRSPDGQSMPMASTESESGYCVPQPYPSPEKSTLSSPRMTCSLFGMMGRAADAVFLTLPGSATSPSPRLRRRGIIFRLKASTAARHSSGPADGIIGRPPSSAISWGSMSVRFWKNVIASTSEKSASVLSQSQSRPVSWSVNWSACSMMRKQRERTSSLLSSWSQSSTRMRAPTVNASGKYSSCSRRSSGVSSSQSSSMPSNSPQVPVGSSSISV